MTTLGARWPCRACGVSVDRIVVDTASDNTLVRCPECGDEHELAIITIAGDMRGEKALSLLPQDSNQDTRGSREELR